ncbi:MAG: S8 family serine peptidase [Candidatus Eisenbacteria bacterium]|uniref:S8 family serine peptidase n=1 Tax=Eiseniibacteriota bacterium TaxID=2212470 RepID=A0A849SNY7_UNCEI|nr:S8 family serine peptidase [Candidatus Eisenbacteria bacterium]
MKILPMLFAFSLLIVGSSTLAALNVPNVHPHRLVLELAPGSPRPGFGQALRPGAAPDRLASSGLAELDAVHARYEPLVYEPMFPTARPPAAGSSGEDLTRFYLVELPASANLSQALADYGAVQGVVGAEPVPLASVDYSPNDPLLGDQWQLGQQSDHDSDVIEAWDLTQGDSTIVIAILDTGVLYSHEDLGGTTAPYTAGNIAHNWVEMGGLPGVDDDGNGFIDDFRGWDFVSAGFGVAGEDVSVADNDPIDFAGHGTFVAGMASARTDNGVGIAGTGFRARLLPLRIGYKDSPTSPGQIDIGYAAQAIVYATNNGAHVINCSWESFFLSALASAANYAIEHGVTLCVAAGNAGSESTGENYLASRGDCIDVAAIDRNDVRVSFSNYGAWIDVSAAGLSVTSTMGRMSVPSYLVSSGTSVAAPFVAGAVSLYQAYRRSLGLPLATPAETRLRVHDTGDNVDALNPSYAGKIGTRINVRRMLSDPLVDVPAAPVTRGPALAIRAMPNPSVSAMRLVLSRASARTTHAVRDKDEVRIYSVTGQLVRALEIPPSADRVATLSWDGTNDQGRRVGTGLYFARARWSGQQAELKLVRMGSGR